jgi:hypothetical protein
MLWRAGRGHVDAGSGKPGRQGRQARLQGAGIGAFEPFFFERQARGPSGERGARRLSLAFADDAAAPECGFFVCEQHEPQNFWNPAFQQHENGATGLSAAIMVTDEPEQHRAFLTAFTGGAEILEGNEDYVLWTCRAGASTCSTARPRSAIYHVEPDPTPARFLGFCVSVADLEAVARG